MWEWMPSQRPSAWRARMIVARPGRSKRLPSGLKPVLVQGVIDRLGETFDVTVEEVDTVRETVSFKLPRALTTEA